MDPQVNHLLMYKREMKKCNFHNFVCHLDDVGEQARWTRAFFEVNKDVFLRRRTFCPTILMSNDIQMCMVINNNNTNDYLYSYEMQMCIVYGHQFIAELYFSQIQVENN